MEYLDVLDGNGHLTGKKKVKTEVHRDGDWHRAVHLWIINSQGELLIQKRSPIKDSYPDMWDISSAGHVSAGEESLASMMREIAEELGLRVSKNELEYLFSVKQQVVLRDGSYINNELNDVYLLTIDLNVCALRLQKEEVSEARWIPYERLEEFITMGSPDFVPHPDEYRQLFSELRRRYG